MIDLLEIYEQINIFKHDKFAKLILANDKYNKKHLNDKNFVKNSIITQNLQNFTNFLCEQFNITENYNIELSKYIDNDIARCDNHKNPKRIYLNEQDFNKYNEYIKEMKY